MGGDASAGAPVNATLQGAISRSVDDFLAASTPGSPFHA